MAFKFKDLAIEVNPEANCCQTGVTNCPSQHVETCYPHFAEDPLQLQLLKASLRAALGLVEAQERALAASEKPQTLAEANDLEQKLQSALEELREQKKDLK